MQSFTPGPTSPANLSVEAMCQLLSAQQASPSPIPASPPSAVSSFTSRMSGSLAGALADASLQLGSSVGGGDGMHGVATVQALQQKLRACSQRVQELEYALHAKAQECSQLDASCKQRIQELEAMCAFASNEQQSAQQLIKNQQIQIVILEEQLKLATGASSDKLSPLAGMPDLSNGSGAAGDLQQLQAAMLLGSARNSATGGPATHPVADAAALPKVPKMPSLAGNKDRGSHPGGASEFTRDHEVWPLGALGPSRTTSLLSAASLADGWGLNTAAAVAADAWQLPPMSQPSAFVAGPLASASWDAAASLLMNNRAHSLAELVPGAMGMTDSDLFAGLDPSRLTSPHPSLTPRHMAGLLPHDLERYLDAAGALESQHSGASSLIPELRPQGSVPGRTMGAHRPLHKQGSGTSGAASMLQRSMSLPVPDNLRSQASDQDRVTMLAAIKQVNRKWTDTWGPELDVDDHADTDLNDQGEGGGAQVSPSGDGEEGGPNQELDAAAQNSRLRSKQDAQPNTCVYVGFLGWWVTEKDLVEYFSPYGQLASVRLLISKKSRRSREQAFVEYSSVDQAQKAITWLDTVDCPALVKQLGCGGLVVRFADRKKPME